MKAEEKARELYPVKNQHVPTIGGRTAYIDVNEKARNAFLKGVEFANQQPEQDKVRELLLDFTKWYDEELPEDEILEKYKALHIGGVSVSLPSVDDAGIIAVEISDINNEMTVQEQAFFIAGFCECVKYLEMQSNER